MAKQISLCALASIFCSLGEGGGAAQVDHAPRPSPIEHRSLQTASNIIWISPLDNDAEELQNVDGTTITIETGTQYELFFEVPDSAQATGFELTFFGQLPGAGWNVDIFNFNFGSNGAYETNIGTLADLTATSTGEATITFSTSSPSHYIDSTNDPSDTIPEVLLRLRGTPGVTGSLDYAAVTAIGGGPAPAPSTVVPPTPGATPTPVGPSPVAQPMATPEGASLCSYVERESGASIPAIQEPCVPFEAIEGASVSQLSTSIKFASTADEQAEYKMYFEAPDPASLTGEIVISVTAQLGIGAVASHWNVDIYNRDTDTWDSKGDLTGVQSGTWTTVDFPFTSIPPTEYVDAGPNEFLVRLLTNPSLSTGVEVIYVDQVVVIAQTTSSATPPPADATPAPVLGATDAPADATPTAAPAVGASPAPSALDTAAPVVLTTSAPATAPVDAVPTPGNPAVYVIKITGGEILLSQMGGGPISNAEGLPVSDTTTSIEFAATSRQAAEYEMYFVSPASVIEGTVTASITAQLGNSAVAEDWKVDIFNRATIGWDPMGADNTLAGITQGQWTTVTTATDSATPADYVEQSTNEILLRLYTDDSGVQVIYVDEVRIAAGPPINPATPAPLPTATSAPVAGTSAPVAATTAPVAATSAPTTAPAATTSAPVAATSAPTIAPAIATIAPAAATSAPTIAPAAATTAPVAATSAPTTAPAAATAAPVAATSAPTIAPVAATTAPAAATSAPTIAPAAATAAPVAATSAPTIAPAAATTAPVAATSAPTIAPVAATSAPVAATSAPTIAPAIATTAPVAATSAPTIAPAIATIAPVAATTSPVSLGDVEVDLVPCIFAQATLEKDVAAVASAYLFGEYFKGFWTASQIVETGTSSTDVLDLLVNDNYGRCSVVFVGIVLSDAQKLQLQAYSRKFKVRIVYFDIADTILDTEVQTRLGMQSLFDQDDGTPDWTGDWTITGPPRVKLVGESTDSVVRSDLETNPKTNNIFNRPVEQTTPLPTGVSILANYVSEDGDVLLGTTNAFAGAQSVGIAEYVGADGLEEMHVFLGLAWFDVGSWAWAHFIAEWGTRGIFQGERRFYLGAVNDDLFLSTGQWEYLPENDFAGDEVRLTADDLAKFQSAEQGFGNVKTEHAFNGLGVLDEVYRNVESPWRSWDGVNANIALLEKGQKPREGGIPQVTKLDWLSTTFNPAEGEPGIADDIADGLFEVDELLGHVQDNLGAFYWQSHTFSHLARDDLGLADCLAEDAGNVQIALLLGLYDSENYNWRSMTSPGITGLFNEYCLQSGDANLMRCYPGDNTYTLANTNPSTVSLINEDNQFHSLTTTTSTNGFAGMQIVPRFATNVYFNCVTGECLINENEKIRRDVCGCAELNPSLDKGSCSNPDCTRDGATNIQSFNNIADLENPSDPKPLQALFEVEERTTTRYILSGRRDKYMFHQANLISTEWTDNESDPFYVTPRPSNSPSLLEYWYTRVLAEMSKYLNTGMFTVETLKFDNLCHNFYQHEDLDNSGAVLTATKDSTGAITGMTLSTTSDNGAPVPLTVPTAIADSVSLGSLSPSETETYGADTTYRFAAGTLNTGELDKPNLDDLYEIPQAGTATVEDEAAQQAADEALEEETPALLETAEEAAEEAEEVANEAGQAVPSLNQ